MQSVDKFIYEEIDDSIRSFIEEKMRAIDGETYTQEDFDTYFSNKHLNVVSKAENGEIMAFCCIIGLNNTKFMGYSWCDNSYQGIKAYSKGLKYIISTYPEVQYIKDILPTFITKRIF